MDSIVGVGGALMDSIVLFGMPKPHVGEGLLIP